MGREGRGGEGRGEGGKGSRREGSAVEKNPYFKAWNKSRHLTFGTQQEYHKW